MWRRRWALLTAFFVSLAGAQPSPERLALCAACHGSGGNSVTAGVPSLAGQPPVYVENQLVLFREGVRQAAQMDTAVKGLSDREIRELAKFFAQSKPASPQGKADPVLVKQARTLARKLRCGSCHGPDFHGRAQMPRLAGQREEYLLEAMNAYRQNRRSGGDTIMTAALYGLPDADIKALAHFLARLR